MMFYEEVLNKLISSGAMSKDDSVLVLCGGSGDAKALSGVGMSNAVISNLDDRYDGYCSPYEWKYLDAENIELDENSVDWAIVHHGLHHCASPHGAVMEMARVARKGILAFEGRDNLTMRLAIRADMVPEFEIYTVALEGGDLGGLRNGPIPNFVYRWTPQEVRKMIESAYPGTQNDIRLFQGLRLPDERMRMSGRMMRFGYAVCRLLAKGLYSLAPSQGNEFAFAFVKSGLEKPWLRNGRLNPDYRLGFDKSRYRGKFTEGDA
jgi:ubiquinone/menaquinone biosynthesis C-methylase UbiE